MLLKIRSAGGPYPLSSSTPSRTSKTKYSKCWMSSARGWVVLSTCVHAIWAIWDTVVLQLVLSPIFPLILTSGVSQRCPLFFYRRLSQLKLISSCFTSFNGFFEGTFQLLLSYRLWTYGRENFDFDGLFEYVFSLSDCPIFSPAETSLVPYFI